MDNIEVSLELTQVVDDDMDMTIRIIMTDRFSTIDMIFRLRSNRFTPITRRGGRASRSSGVMVWTKRFSSQECTYSMRGL